MERGSTALKDLQSRQLSGSAELLHLDVNSEDSIQKAARLVEEKHGRYYLKKIEDMDGSNGIQTGCIGEQCRCCSACRRCYDLGANAEDLPDQRHWTGADGPSLCATSPPVDQNATDHQRQFRPRIHLSAPRSECRGLPSTRLTLSSQQGRPEHGHGGADLRVRQGRVQDLRLLPRLHRLQLERLEQLGEQGEADE